jgi:hypothetical protein
MVGASFEAVVEAGYGVFQVAISILVVLTKLVGDICCGLSFGVSPVTGEFSAHLNDLKLASACLNEGLFSVHILLELPVSSLHILIEIGLGEENKCADVS